MTNTRGKISMEEREREREREIPTSVARSLLCYVMLIMIVVYIVSSLSYFGTMGK